MNNLELSYDKNKLIALRNEIIDNCSEVVHHHIALAIAPIESERIRNIKKGEKINANSILYNYDYDEYVFPYLVTLIDAILNGQTEATNEILNPNRDKEKHFDLRRKNYDKKQIEKLFNEFEHINYFDIEARRKILIELDKQILGYQKEVGIKPVGPYYLQVATLLNIKENNNKKIKSIHNKK